MKSVFIFFSLLALFKTALGAETPLMLASLIAVGTQTGQTVRNFAQDIALDTLLRSRPNQGPSLSYDISGVGGKFPLYRVTLLFRYSINQDEKSYERALGEKMSSIGFSLEFAGPPGSAESVAALLEELKPFHPQLLPSFSEANGQLGVGFSLAGDQSHGSFIMGLTVPKNAQVLAQIKNAKATGGRFDPKAFDFPVGTAVMSPAAAANSIQDPSEGVIPALAAETAQAAMKHVSPVRPRLAIYFLGTAVGPATEARFEIERLLKNTGVIDFSVYESSSGEPVEAPVTGTGHVHPVEISFRPYPDLVIGIDESGGELISSGYKPGTSPLSNPTAYEWIIRRPLAAKPGPFDAHSNRGPR